MKHRPSPGLRPVGMDAQSTFDASAEAEASDVPIRHKRLAGIPKFRHCCKSGKSVGTYQSQWAENRASDCAGSMGWRGDSAFRSGSWTGSETGSEAGVDTGSETRLW